MNQTHSLSPEEQLIFEIIIQPFIPNSSKIFLFNLRQRMNNFQDEINRYYRDTALKRYTLMRKVCRMTLYEAQTLYLDFRQFKENDLAGECLDLIVYLYSIQQPLLKLPKVLEISQLHIHNNITT